MFTDTLNLLKPKPSAEELLDTNFNIVLIPATLFKCVKKGREFSLLIDLVVGHVITDINKEEHIPIVDITHLSAIQLEILDKALKLITFNAELLAKETSHSLVKIESLLDTFTKTGFFTQKNRSFVINKHLRLISHPEDFAFYGKPIAEKITYNGKLKAIIHTDDMRKKLGMFVDIKEISYCWIVGKERA